VVLSSGTYRVSKDEKRPNVLAYFGADTAQYDARSPITHVHRTDAALLLTVSEFDPPPLAAPTFELAAKLTNVNGRTPRLLWLAGHNHVSNVLSIGTEDNGAANLLADFFRAPFHSGPSARRAMSP
jgi:triacylglycerol lipase